VLFNPPKSLRPVTNWAGSQAHATQPLQPGDELRCYCSSFNYVHPVTHITTAVTQAVSQAHATQPLQPGDELRGQEITDARELRSLLDDLDMAQACYKRSMHAAAAYCYIKVCCATKPVLRCAITCVWQGLCYDVQLRVCDKACVTSNYVCATRPVLWRAITCVWQGLCYDVQLRACDKACVTSNYVCATRPVLRRAITCVRQGLYYDVQLRVCDKACITTCNYVCATRPVLRAVTSNYERRAATSR